MRQAEQGPSIPYMEGPCPIVPKQNAPPTNDTPAKGCRNEHAGQHRDDGKPSGPAFGQVTASRRSRRRRNPAGQAGTPLIKCIREAHVAGRPGGRVGLGNHGKKAARCQWGLRGIEMATSWALSIPRLRSRGQWSSALRMSVKPLRRSRRHAALGMQRGTQRDTRHRLIPVDA